MSGFLIRSLVLSAVLTILLNAFLIWRGRRSTDDFVDRRPPSRPGPPSVRVVVPWKAMLIGSIGLTVALNLIAWLAR